MSNSLKKRDANRWTRSMKLNSDQRRWSRFAVWWSPPNMLVCLKCQEHSAWCGMKQSPTLFSRCPLFCYHSIVLSLYKNAPSIRRWVLCQYSVVQLTCFTIPSCIKRIIKTNHRSWHTFLDIVLDWVSLCVDSLFIYLIVIILRGWNLFKSDIILNVLFKNISSPKTITIVC